MLLTCVTVTAPWKDGSGELNYYIDACNCLRLLYTRMGELCSDPEEILANYQLAHDYAALCDNKLQIKQVSHKLGWLAALLKIRSTHRR